jgi:hypothetical protein
MGILGTRESVARSTKSPQDPEFMATQTEAACLLETGALYTKRIMFRAGQSDPIFAGIKQGVFSLYYGDAPIYHFDLDGRWQRAFVGGTHFLKSLDGTVQAIDRVREGANMVLKRRTLAFAEASDLDGSVRSAALELLEALNCGRLEHVAPPTTTSPLLDDEVRDLLDRIAGWDAARWFAQREKYLGTYGPLPIVPPDCHHAVVLQATLGHAGGRNFGYGAGAEHYVRSPAEFDEHARTVAELLGRRILQCKAIFVGGSDFLRLPNEQVAADLEIVAREFPSGLAREGPGMPASSLPGGVHTFLEDLAHPQLEPAAWRRYGQLGLKRVHLGIESGDRQIRAQYGKTWDNDDLIGTVTEIKASGIGVSVLVLIGAGGLLFAERHLDATIQLIESLPLGAGDLISLLDANELADPGSVGDGPGRIPVPLSGTAWSAQQAELKKSLAAFRARTGAKVAPYSLEKQGASQY